jgi:UDP-N-acetylglucosamine 1-carboxyvinyltransferase
MQRIPLILEDRPINHSLSLKDTHSLPEEDKSVLQIWGRASLHGHVKISGAKNSALAIMAGALLCPEDCRLSNVPSLVDITRMGQILSALGVKLERSGDTLDINASPPRTVKSALRVGQPVASQFFCDRATAGAIGSRSRASTRRLCHWC